MMGPRLGLLGLLVVVITVVSQSFTQEDFEGNLPEIGTSPVDLVFVIDTSAATNDSAGLEDELQIKSFFASFLESADTDSGAVRVGMVTYSTHPEVVFKLDSFRNKVEIQAAVLEAEFRGGERNTADALSRVRSQMLVPSAGDRRDVPNVILLFTSGKSDRNSDRTLQEADALKYAKTNIFVLGYGLSGAGVNEAQDMASKPVTENSFEVTSIDELDLIREIVFAQIFTRAEMAYKSPAAGSEQLDMGFLIHFSSKMKRKDFKNMLTFMRRILDFASLDDDSVRVGAAVYRKRGTLLFDFKQYQTRDDITKAIESIPYSYRAKATGTASGLDVIRTELFNAQAGDRDNVPNLLVVITDSNADVNVGQTIKASEQLKATGTAIFTVGLNVTYKEELTSISTSPEYSVFVNDTQYLSDQEFMLQDLFVALRAEEEVEYVIPEKQTTLAPTVASTETTTTIVYTTNFKELDVVLALHVSDNANPKDVKAHLLPFLQDIVSASDIKSGAVRLSLVTFGNDAKIRLNFKAGRKPKKVIKTIKKLKPATLKSHGSNADLANVLDTIQKKLFVKKAGDRPGVQNLVMLMTDTSPSSSPSDTLQYAEALKKDDTTIFTIGVGTALADDMSSIASEPTDAFTFTGNSYRNYTDSLTLRQKIAQQIKIFENLKVPKTPQPSKSTIIPTKEKTTKPLTVPTKEKTTKTIIVPAKEKTTKPVIVTSERPTKRPNVVEIVEVSTKKSNIIPEITPSPATASQILVTSSVLSFTSQTSVSPVQRLFPPLSESENADIVFALHLSPTATPFDFGSVQNFLQQVVSGVDIESGNVKIGVMFYAADPEVIFHINQYDNVEDMIRSIQGLDNMKRDFKTDASGALDLGRQMLSSYFGRRGDVPAALIFITDSASTTNVDLIEPKQETAVESGIDIYAIGINLPDKSELETLATSPNNVMTVLRYGELYSNIDYLQRNIRALRSSSAEAFGGTVTSTAKVTKPSKPAGPSMTLPPFTETPPIRVTLPGSSTLSDGKLFEHSLMKDERNLTPLAQESWCGNTSYDLVIILDSSTSVQIQNWKIMTDATKSFVNKLNIDDGNFRVGLMSYSSGSTIHFHLNEYNRRKDVLNAFSNVLYTYGRTNTAEALHDLRREMFTARNGDRPGIPNIAVIVTDGESNINVDQTIPEADLAREAGITVFAIGIGLKATTELDAIAGVRTNRFFIDRFDQLEAKMETLYTFVCPDTRTSNADLALSLSQVSSGLSCSGTKLDIVFLLDASSSMGRNNFVTMINATKTLVQSEDIESGNIRVGVLTYSTDVEIQFHLNYYNTLEDLLFALDNINFMAGSTNIADALNIMRTIMFTEQNGARLDSSKVGILITDGISNINFENVLPESDLARKDGILMLAIGVGLVTTREIDSIAGKPENRININDFDELEMRLDSLFRSVCGRTLTSFDLPELSCGQIDLDLVFLLDSSTSISNSDFNKMLNVTNSFIQSTSIDNGRVRVGAALYSSSVSIQFHLNYYRTKTEIKNAIQSIQHTLGDTNIADALYKVRTEMFTTRNGDRGYVPNLIIVITDGTPNVNQERTLPEARLTKSAGIRIFVVGVRVEETYVLDQIASQPAQENRLSINEFDQLRLEMDKLFTPVCSQYVGPVARRPGTTCRLGRLDLVIILDASTSVTEPNFKKMLDFTKRLLSGADIDSGAVKVGVVVYSTDVTVEFQMNRYSTKRDVLNAIDNIKYIYGSTNTADAIKTMADEMFTSRNGDRPDVEDACIVITDGVSNINSRYTVEVAQDAHKKNIHIYAIGIGLTDREELDKIATPPAAENSFLVKSFEDLDGLEDKLFKSLCPAAGPPTNATGSCGLTNVDLVLVLDASTSVTEKNFQTVRDFCVDLVDRADISSGSVRVGALIYSNTVHIQFHLKDYRTKAEIENAIAEIPYIFGGTNTADALRTVYTEMFTEVNGDRPGVDNLIVVVTDGVSTINDERTIPEAVYARSRNIQIYAVGIGLTNTTELDDIASRPIAEHRFNAKNFDELSEFATLMFGSAEQCDGIKIIADIRGDTTK